MTGLSTILLIAPSPGPDHPVTTPAIAQNFMQHFKPRRLAAAQFSPTEFNYSIRAHAACSHKDMTE
ncbi:hypothetical protein [Sphingorhabdus sp. SMR4y]|uniref:hypothetical protein n=1 Tax=Sphingorhabdus sp. SMR4y TaxID=2584094 RepID=UPI000B5C2C65|nr:hypothetical protein [Sphingorhabdus sp. SMR4y]